MTYKNLLVHLDDSKACRKRMETAVAIAAAHNAHLAGLFCVGAFELPTWAEVPRDMIEEQRKLDEKRAAEVSAEFEEAAKRAGINYEVRHANVADYAVPDTVALHARYSDMVILGQSDPDEVREGTRVLVEHVVMAAGRPVLAVPYIGPVKHHGAVQVGRRIMVAWDAGREATRAVNDAMPFLEAAEKVDVLAVNPSKSRGKHGDQPGADIALHLARHGVKVEVQQLDVKDLEPGETLLSRLSDTGSDLLVMGAYGHSRMRELILGGATRTVLEHMTVPVMMSH